jgi:hypothetical protein
MSGDNSYCAFVYFAVGNPLTSSQYKMAEPLGCGIRDAANSTNVVIDKGHHCIKAWKRACYWEVIFVSKDLLFSYNIWIIE